MGDVIYLPCAVTPIKKEMTLEEELEMLRGKVQRVEALRDLVNSSGATYAGALIDIALEE